MKNHTLQSDAFYTNLEVSQLIMAGLHDEAKKLAETMTTDQLLASRKALIMLKKKFNELNFSDIQKSTIEQKISIIKTIVNSRYNNNCIPA